MEEASLRVGIDVSALALTRAGSARYLTRLLHELEREPAFELVRYAFRGDGRAAKVARDVAWYPLRLPALARRDRVAVLHCPTLRAPLRSPAPLVITVHDLAVVRHPDAFNRWTREYSAVVLPRLLPAATVILTGSHFTRNELVDVLGVDSERIRVTPYGVGEPFSAEGTAAEGDYVLAVSTLEPRKNLPRLVEGFRRASLEGVELRVAGAAGWGGVRVGGDSIRWLGEVSDEELARLYRGAACVAYVSVYEGFGLPILEAMACGTPVVTTGWGACAEVAGDAAVLVDALDSDAIGAGLAESLGRKDELVSRGLERAREFTWERTALGTANAYLEVA
jgi:glycosyltransferase involved in cell wall biosynthesis